ncbi:DAK2 domain-containing protein [Streptomyces marispadix]|uniref:DAK2 domain-containing protein n=1 Tax=Streptomyces marispadix TaxID=2922868 RepID=A0ABS9T2T6_9ACTN|nr:DAK2 domain-containing protein [Streptomyces marispadix]MCH6162832.1 DAK2 domain-containing protein [Streptomyces marispadix]
MPQPFDSAVVREWIASALDAVGEGRAEIDAINVFPVADGDTGTNLHRTLDAAAQALHGEPDGGADGASRRSEEPPGSAAPALRALARGALLGACGNSGTILAQLLRGMAEVYGADQDVDPDADRGADLDVDPDLDPDARDAGGGAEVPGGGRLLAEALRRAAESAYEAVARPVEGTMLSVATAAAEAAVRTVRDDPGADAAAVALAAHDRSREALSETTDQLDVLRRAGVVDAGGSGLVAVLGALADALAGGVADGGASRRARRTDARSAGTGGGSDSEGGRSPEGGRSHGVGRSPGSEAGDAGDGGGAYEVMYLLDADDGDVAALRERLDELGDSLVVGGGDGLWSVHVHVDDAGAAVEAGVGAGRPHRIRITHLTRAATGEHCAPEPAGHPGSGADAEDREEPPHGRAVVAVVNGDGLAGLCEEAGASVVRAKELTGGEQGDERGEGGEGRDGGPLTAVVRATGAAEVVLLPNDGDLHAAAARAAEESRAAVPELRVAVVPTRAAVQGIAALAVHDPERRFDDDVVAMTNAAGATRYGEVAVAERRFWTMAGVCEAGDALGLVEDDVVVIGDDVAATAAEVLERMLSAGGELVTLVVGEHAPRGLAERLEEQVRSRHLAVDTVVYEGRGHSSLLLIGVE